MDSLNTKLYKAEFGGYTLTASDKMEVNRNRLESASKFNNVISNLSHTWIFSITWFRLLSRDWIAIYGDAESEKLKEWNGMTNMQGQPAFVVKELDGNYYHFRGLDNPGFPGS